MLPSGIVASGLPAVERTCAEIGLGFDPWQVDSARCILGKQSSGDYAADTIVLSIPRQVGKTFLVGLLVFADSIIHPGTTTVWTAHRFKVARETFNELRGIAISPRLAPHIDPDDIYTAAGNESITFRNGSRIVFAARERGAIRGFTKVRRLVLDEAQILSEGAMSDLAPTQNQAVNPQIILMGTPPKPTDPGEVFTHLRTEALAGEAEGVVYIEFSADEDADPNDIEQWEKANPSLHTRTPISAIRRLRKLLGSDDDFAREALGIWPDTSTLGVIPERAWANCLTPDSKIDGPKVLALEVAEDRAWSTIAAAGTSSHGGVHGEVADNRPKTAWVVPRLVEMAEAHKPAALLIAKNTPAHALVPELEAAGIKLADDGGILHLVSTVEMGQACGSFFDSVTADAPTFRHIGQGLLDVAVRTVKKKPAGDTFVWQRRQADITPLVAVTLAHYGFNRFGTAEEVEPWFDVD